MTAPIVAEFLELVRLPVHSRRERVMADRLKEKLVSLGFEVEEDNTGALIGGDSGSLIGRLKGRSDVASILFSAHMDRVENHGRIQPRVGADGIIVSDGTSILAADDVSGLVSILDGVRRIQGENIAHGDIEIVFSVAEEVGLLGARHLDYSRLKSKMAFVIDAGGPVGTIVNQAPSQYTIRVRVHGRASHAGIEPEKGLSAVKIAAGVLAALPEGRLSPRSTSNFGVIAGGKAANIVCDLVEITGEARSTDSGELSDYLAQVKLAFAEAAARWQTEIEVETELEYSAFKVDENDQTIRLAARAYEQMGVTHRITASGGGSDANYFNANGLTAIGLSPGYTGVHSHGEAQSVDDLAASGRFVAELIKQAARPQAGA